MILKSLIRTFFLEQAFKTFLEGVGKNLRVPGFKVYPRTEEGLRYACIENDIYIERELDPPLHITEGIVETLMCIHGLEGVFEILSESECHGCPRFE